MRALLVVILLFVYSSIGIKSNAQNSKQIQLIETEQNKVLFKVSGAFMEYPISGILILKQMSETEYRAVMTMETGIKVYDISIKKGKKKLLESMPMYKNAFVKKMLFRDLDLLLHFPFLEPASQIFEQKIKEGKSEFIYKKGETNSFQKIRIKGKAEKEKAVKRYDENGLIMESDHAFHKFPYKATYTRIINH